MSFTLPSRTPSGPRRRSLLVGAAGAALLVGCSFEEEDSAAADGSPAAAERARARVARDSEGLAERYAAVIAAHPALAEVLTPLRAEVVRHAKAFGGDGTGTASVAPSASASASPVPADEKAALAELAAAERKLADKRAKALLKVEGELARLMASVAAAGAGHAFVLTEGAK